MARDSEKQSSEKRENEGVWKNVKKFEETIKRQNDKVEE